MRAGLYVNKVSKKTKHKYFNFSRVINIKRNRVFS